MSESYNPRPEAEAILDRAYELVKSVPYAVTARWLFYGLLQEGTYPDKDSYKSKFLPMLSKARKSFFNGWTPDTLADDTRVAVVRGDFLQVVLTAVDIGGIKHYFSSLVSQSVVV
jgi:ABC-type antimicrobial peptide transport system ATPase subunit